MSFRTMHRLWSSILLFVLRTLGKLPLSVHYAFADFVSWLAGSVLHYRRDVVDINLARSFPDLKYAELKQIRKDFYRHFGEIFGEAIWFAGCTNPERLRKARIVQLTNPEELDRLYETTPSVFVLASHTGNWELIGGFYSYADKFACKENDFAVVYKRLSSKVWDDVMKRSRISPIADKAGFDGIVETRTMMRYMVSHRSDRKIYDFITDQHPYEGASGVDVGEFMHQPARSMDGAAKLAAKFGMSVAYLGMDRVERGRYRLTVTTICDDASSMSPEDIMKRYYQLLQRDLEANPSNYLWTHKRWK